MTGSFRHAVRRLVRPDTSFALPALTDFDLGPPEPVDPALLARRDLVPWGLDLASGSVILLDYIDVAALRIATFVYQEQAAQATSVVLAPYAAFVDAWDGRGPPGGGGAVASRDARRRPVFLHSVGRCGSTLLAQALTALRGVCPLSEPGVYSAIQSGVETGALDDAQAVALLRAATAALATNVAGADTLLVKTRSEDARVWPLFDAAHPDARAVFLYRDAVPVVQSFDRILGYPHGRTQGIPDREALFARQLPAYEAALRTRFFARASAHVTTAQRACGPWAGLLLAEWIDKARAYLDARERAPERVFALRYEDLVAHPAALLADLAAFLGHTWPPDAGLPAGDSQEGTALEAVDTPLHPLDAATLAGIARAGHAVLGDAFARLPGTWRPDTPGPGA